jgi:hypothetical protein
MSDETVHGNMDIWIRFRRTAIAEMRPYRVGEHLHGVSISPVDELAGSPKLGDMIARNPKNHEDRWLVAKQYFADNFEPIRLFVDKPTIWVTSEK